MFPTIEDAFSAEPPVDVEKCPSQHLQAACESAFEGHDAEEDRLIADVVHALPPADPLHLHQTLASAKNNYDLLLTPPPLTKNRLARLEGRIILCHDTEQICSSSTRILHPSSTTKQFLVSPFTRQKCVYYEASVTTNTTILTGDLYHPLDHHQKKLAATRGFLPPQFRLALRLAGSDLVVYLPPAKFLKTFAMQSRFSRGAVRLRGSITSEDAKLVDIELSSEDSTTSEGGDSPVSVLSFEGTFREEVVNQTTNHASSRTAIPKSTVMGGYTTGWLAPSRGSCRSTSEEWSQSDDESRTTSISVQTSSVSSTPSRLLGSSSYNESSSGARARARGPPSSCAHHALVLPGVTGKTGKTPNAPRRRRAGGVTESVRRRREGVLQKRVASFMEEHGSSAKERFFLHQGGWAEEAAGTIWTIYCRL